MMVLPTMAPQGSDRMGLVSRPAITSEHRSFLSAPMKVDTMRVRRACRRAAAGLVQLVDVSSQGITRVLLAWHAVARAAEVFPMSLHPLVAKSSLLLGYAVLPFLVQIRLPVHLVEEEKSERASESE